MTTLPIIRTPADRLRGPAKVNFRGVWWTGPTIRRKRCGAVVRCAWCSRIQTLAGRWIKPEGVDLSRSTDTICPTCTEQVRATLYADAVASGEVRVCAQ